MITPQCHLRCRCCGHPPSELSRPVPRPAPQVPLSAEQFQQARYERELDERNRPLSDEELDAIMPATGACSAALPKCISCKDPAQRHCCSTPCTLCAVPKRRAGLYA